MIIEQETFYPQRVTHEKFELPAFTEKLELTDEDKVRVIEFENSLYDRLKEVEKIEVNHHIIYPEAFTTQEGSKLFKALYVDRSIRDEKQIDTDQLQEVSPYSLEEIEQMFFNTDLRHISEGVRKWANNYSSRYAEARFKEQFVEARGNTTQVESPYRIGKVIEPSKLLKKIGPEGYRGFKKTIKEYIRQVNDEEPSNLNKAKLAILQMYQWHVNTELAGLYLDARILAERPSVLNSSQRKVLQAVPGLKWRSSLNARSAARLDRFLTGIGEGNDAKGIALPHTKRMEELSSTISKSGTDEEKETDPYEDVTVNADQAIKLGNLILRMYGFYGEGEGGWKITAPPERRVTTISGKKKEVQISQNFNRSITSTLILMAHEIEGHVLSRNNQKVSMSEGINLGVKKYMGGNRNWVMLEAAGDLVEEGTRRSMLGYEKPASNRYLLALKEKARGGSFANCFQVIFESRLADDPEEKFDKVFASAYGSTRRIFGNYTNYQGGEPYAQDTAELAYLEQALLVQDLQFRHSEVLEKLLFINGVDLQSAEILYSLGFLDLSKVNLPQYLVATKVWPVIKEALDKGLSLDEAIEEGEKTLLL